MKKIEFQNAEIINPAKVTIEGIDYEVTPAQLTVIEKYLSAETLNEIQDNMEEIGVVVSPTEPTTNEKVWLQKGKNLLKLEETSKTLNGVTMTINSDGSITLNGTATDNTPFYISKQKIKLIGDYTFGITTDFSAIGHGFEVGGYVYGADGQYKYNISTNQPTKTLSDGEYISNFNIYFSSGAVFNNFVIYPQLEQGSTATEYEAYIDKKIYCKNDNGVFEEFVNAETMGIETITNENGTAIKFPDGTLICKGMVSVPANNAGIEKQFPVPFVTENVNTIQVCLTNIYAYSRSIMWSGQATSLTTLGAYPFDVTSNATPTVESSANYTAIGRWK